MEELKEVIYRILNGESKEIKFDVNFDKDLRLFAEIASIVDEGHYYKKDFYTDLLNDMKSKYIKIIESNIQNICVILNVIENLDKSLNYKLKIKGVLTCWCQFFCDNTPSIYNRLKIFDNLYALKDKVIYVDLSIYQNNTIKENINNSVRYHISYDKKLVSKNIISINTFVDQIKAIESEHVDGNNIF